ncbi:MAG: sigma-70 family RNA polymerase sigma factor [Phycisphaerales bacterium]|nr:sigma-70 family RNA polymerase sigma factor [Phycisphaerales bacterium]
MSRLTHHPEAIVESGVPAATLIALLHQELKLMARSRLALERPGHTLSATALVNEVYLRLRGAERTWPGKHDFFLAAAEAMRRVLIDHARKRRAEKRGGGLKRVELDRDLGLECKIDSSVDAGVLDEYIERLRVIDPPGHRVVMLRYFAGLAVHDIADLLGADRRTITRRWRVARAWLLERLSDGESRR